jgi:hypothetical protein
MGHGGSRCFVLRLRIPASLNLIVRRNMKRRRSVFKTVIAPIVVLVVFVPTLAVAVWMVLHGRGAESYSNVYGLAIHYTSVPIFVLALVLAVAVAYVARIIYFWRNAHDGTAKLRKIESLASSDDSISDK